MNILLGVTGSVAATLTPKIVSELSKNKDNNVQIIITKNAGYFFNINGFDYYNIKLWQDADEWQPYIKYVKNDDIPHIDLCKWADVLLIAPLTANTLAKMANGLADNLLTSTIRAWSRKNPIILAPAMNTYMWNHPATDEHLQKIKRWFNVIIIPPIEKKLACGDTGIGALADISDIIKTMEIINEGIKTFGKSFRAFDFMLDNYEKMVKK